MAEYDSAPTVSRSFTLPPPPNLNLTWSWLPPKSNHCFSAWPVFHLSGEFCENRLCSSCVILPTDKLTNAYESIIFAEVVISLLLFIICYTALPVRKLHENSCRNFKFGENILHCARTWRSHLEGQRSRSHGPVGFSNRRRIISLHRTRRSQALCADAWRAVNATEQCCTMFVHREAHIVAAIPPRIFMLQLRYTLCICGAIYWVVSSGWTDWCSKVKLLVAVNYDAVRQSVVAAW